MKSNYRNLPIRWNHATTPTPIATSYFFSWVRIFALIEIIWAYCPGERTRTYAHMRTRTQQQRTAGKKPQSLIVNFQVKYSCYRCILNAILERDCQSSIKYKYTRMKGRTTLHTYCANRAVVWACTLFSLNTHSDRLYGVVKRLIVKTSRGGAPPAGRREIGGVMNWN